MRKAPKGIPLLFGRGVRECVLLLLNANGPLQLRDLVYCIRCDAKKIRRALLHFERQGIAAKTDLPGHRKYWTLDRRFLAYDELRLFLRKLSDHWETPHLDVPSRREGGPNFRIRPRIDPSVLAIFGSGTRTRTLIAIAIKENSNIQEITRMVGARYESVHYVVRGLVRQRICRSIRVGRDRQVLLNTGFVASAELRKLLEKLGRAGVFGDD